MMTVMVLERVPAGLRGKLTRWMLELRAGVFVGTLSGRVREKLWADVCKRRRGVGACTIVHGAQTEQGYVIQTIGDTSRAVADFDGLQLMRKEAVAGKE